LEASDHQIIGNVLDDLRGHLFGVGRRDGIIVAKDFKAGDGSPCMKGPVKIGKSEFLETLAGLPSLGSMPHKLSGMLNVPEEGIMERSEDSIYFIVPTDNYSEKHADPFDVLTGEDSGKLDWAGYIFGIRYHGTYASVVLVDKARRFSMAVSVLGAHGEKEPNWEKAEESLNEALSYASNDEISARIRLDHVNLTSMAGVEFIESHDPRAWG
jgi:hypothetical protein